MVLLPVFPGEPPHAEDQHDRASVAGESAFPDFEYLKETLPRGKIIVESVEQAVPKAGANKGTQQESVKKRVEEVLVNLLPLEELREHPVAQDKS